MKNVLEIKNLSKSYEDTTILEDISFNVAEGEFVAIMGRSGSGKSTLLYCVSGMDKMTSGSVLFSGQELSSIDEKGISAIRLQQMGFIFQHAYLLKKLSIRDNVVLPGFKAQEESREEVNRRADQLMEKTGIAPIGDHDIRKVSGGQLQRAAICRALINRPKIVFGDEPTGALNSSAAKEVMDIVSDIHKEGTTVVLVTHDAKVASRADRIIFLADGKILDELRLPPHNGSPEDGKSREEKLFTWLEKMEF
jgi:putative ABC transport system ATP-binding protein